MIIGSEIRRFEKLSSTNDHASNLIRTENVREGTVVVAAYQTSGKGQGGKTWESEEGKNLLFSAILYPHSVTAEDHFYISIAISLGICDFVDSRTGGCKIKWPNDIYFGNDKIAGILIENSLIGETIESSVVGVGLNLNQVTFADAIPNPVSLKLITGTDHDTENCLKDLLYNLDERYRELLYGNRKKMMNNYISRLYRLYEFHSFRAEEKIFEARITGISESGSLKIQNKDMSASEFRFKEIDYVL